MKLRFSLNKLKKINEIVVMFGLSEAELLSLGYLGIFALSLGTNLIVFIPVPYLLLILLAALSGQFDPALLVISSAIGATAGKMIVFQSFYSGSRIIGENARKNLNTFQTIFANYAWIAVFLAAATPIPDDIVYVPLGLGRYNRMRFFTALLAGKTIITLLVVYGAVFLTNTVFGPIFVGSGQAGLIELIIAGSAFAIVAVVVTLLISRFDWEKWGQKRIAKRGKKN